MGTIEEGERGVPKARILKFCSQITGELIALAEQWKKISTDIYDVIVSEEGQRVRAMVEGHGTGGDRRQPELPWYGVPAQNAPLPPEEEEDSWLEGLSDAAPGSSGYPLAYSHEQRLQAQLLHRSKLESDLESTPQLPASEASIPQTSPLFTTSQHSKYSKQQASRIRKGLGTASDGSSESSSSHSRKQRSQTPTSRAPSSSRQDSLSSDVMTEESHLTQRVKSTGRRGSTHGPTHGSGEEAGSSATRSTRSRRAAPSTEPSTRRPTSNTGPSRTARTSIKKRRGS